MIEFGFVSEVDFVAKIHRFIVSILWGYRWGYLTAFFKDID